MANRLYRTRPLISRRRALALGGLTVAAPALTTGCDAFSTEPSSDEPPAGSPTGTDNADHSGAGKQAPQLAADVEAGSLPPLDERIPTEPMVIKPTSSTGVYGGRWRTILPEVEAYDAYGKVGYDNMVRWDPKWTKVVPNIAASWHTENGGRDTIFKLRPGMKWSDGKPFTADDVEFAYNDVLRNEKLYPVFPSWLTSDGRPAEVEKIDVNTVRVGFRQPNSFFLMKLAAPDGNVLTSLPKHYLKQFHIKYNNNADRVAEKEGFSDWAELFFSKGGGGLLDLGGWQTPDLPTILAWRVTTPMRGSRLVLKRNPYYWKTDPQGKQLPYLDEVVADVGMSPQVAVLKISHGEYTLPDSAAVLPTDKPVYARSRTKGKFHFVKLVNADMNNATLMFNMMHKDPAKRALFQNKDFRIGMSYAINRPELIQALFQRQGIPYQAAPRPESDFYDERFAKQYTEYSPKKANQHLDAAGLSRRNSQGIRLRPDGEPVAFTLKFMLGWFKYFSDVAERVQAYWRDVGVEVRIKSEEQTKFTAGVPTNTHDAIIYGGDNGMRDAIIRPGLYFPYSESSYFAIPWGTWYATRGESGEEPPAPAREQMKLYDKIAVTLDRKVRQSLFRKLLEISRDELYVMGTALPKGHFNVVQNSFHNVPKSFPDGSVYPNPGPTQPEQYFVEQ